MKIIYSMYCAKCGKRLEADKGPDGKITKEKHEGDRAEVAIYITPCDCQTKQEEDFL